MMKVAGPWFKDEDGRVMILRGVNLGGSSKLPFTPDGATWRREGFFDHRKVSFVGRPFPLEEADEHLARLKRWGFTFLRLLVTWEAIEHAGPGIYDEEYLDYVRQVVVKAHEHGIQLFIDPHQDVWSRFSGGDGAPGWTFEAAGMQMENFQETGAALVHCLLDGPLPRMIWPTNYGKLAAATLFTLFFGGNDFAPSLKVDGEPIQEFLQGHYIRAVQQVALRLQGLPNVAGYDSLNEPSAGYIGLKNLLVPPVQPWMGEMPSVLEGMALGAGIPLEIGVWKQDLLGRRRTQLRRVNPRGLRAWQDGVECIWQAHGVWEPGPGGRPRLLKPDYFSRVNGRAVDFGRDYLQPFAARFACAIRQAAPGAPLFFESPPEQGISAWQGEDLSPMVNAAHWYDVVTLLTKTFRPWVSADHRSMKLVLGRKAVNRMFADQLGEIKAWSQQRLGNVPTLIGEFGIPLDMDHKRAYRTGDFSRQVQALDAAFQALEANLLSGTLWNYTADNDNLHGDQWNDEDLSLFSRDQQADPADPDSGGRALQAAVRPYAVRTAGEPLSMRFEAASGEFTFSFRHDPQVSAPTEIFLPALQYPRGPQVSLSDGRCEVDAANQRLLYYHDPAAPQHHIRIRR